MTDYLKSILPRLQRYSKQLSEEANFVDVPWAFRDVDGAVVTYLFRRNNELLVTKQGEVVTGRWEYIASLRSLLIEYEGRKRLYNQGYLDPEKAVLILRKDGTEELFVLGNKEVIVGLDVAGYLEGRLNLLENKKMALTTEPGKVYTQKYRVKDSERVLVLEFAVNSDGDRDFIIGSPVLDANTEYNMISGEYQLEDGKMIQIINGALHKVEDARSSEISFKAEQGSLTWLYGFVVFLIMVGFMIMVLFVIQSST